MAAPESRDAGTWAALFGLFVVAVSLLGLMAMVAPHILGIALIVLAFLGFGAFHYLLWGWWLGATLSKPPDDAAPAPDKSATEENRLSPRR
jgi:hypothetical protein